MGCGVSAEPSRSNARKPLPTYRGGTVVAGGPSGRTTPTVSPHLSRRSATAERNRGVTFEHCWLTSLYDGNYIYSVRWDPRNAAERRAVVVFLHGFASHIHASHTEENFIIPLAQAGYMVVGFDMRGHGQTAKANNTQGLCGTADVHVMDYITVLRYVESMQLGVEIFVAGFSMGGAQTFDAMASHHTLLGNIAGVILLAPGCGSNLVGPFAPVINVLNKIIPTTNLSDISTRLANLLNVKSAAAVSRNPDNMSLTADDLRNILMEFNTEDHQPGDDLHLSVDEFTRIMNEELNLDLSPVDVAELRAQCDANRDGKVHVEEFVEAYKRADDYVDMGTEFTPSMLALTVELDARWKDVSRAINIRTPILLAHGLADTVNLAENSKKVVESTSSFDKTVKLFPRMRHGLFSDLGSEEVLQTALRWLAARVQVPSKGVCTAGEWTLEDLDDRLRNPCHTMITSHSAPLQPSVPLHSPSLQAVTSGYLTTPCSPAMWSLEDAAGVWAPSSHTSPPMSPSSLSNSPQVSPMCSPLCSPTLGLSSSPVLYQMTPASPVLTCHPGWDVQAMSVMPPA